MSEPSTTMSTASRVLPVSFRFLSFDLDDARSILDRFYYSLTLDAPDGVDDFALRGEVIQLGPLVVGHLHSARPVTMAARELNAYHVTMPLNGRVHVRHAGHEVTAGPSTAAVFRPGHSVHTRHDADTAEFHIKIERSALEGELAELLGRHVPGPIDLPPVMNLSAGAGQSWSRMVRLLRDESRHQHGLLYQPLIAEQLRHSVLSGLLLSLPHRYHHELITPTSAQPGPPRAVRRAVEAVRAEPELPFTVADLAGISGTSVRSLQEGFRRHVGMAPMAYLQHVRLERVHETLRQADPARTTVAEVAYRWGFAHLGRFARAYRHRYGRAPSETLRGHCR
ncbi:MAG TPA: AraC family transcriptional regulator [Actinoplanes sp.]